MKGIAIRKDLKIKPPKEKKEYLNPKEIYLLGSIPVDTSIKKGQQVDNEYASISGICTNTLSFRNTTYTKVLNNYKEEDLLKKKTHSLESLIKEEPIYEKLKGIDTLSISALDKDPRSFECFAYLAYEQNLVESSLLYVRDLLNLKQITLLVSDDYEEVLSSYKDTFAINGVSIQIVPYKYPYMEKESLLDLKEVIRLYKRCKFGKEDTEIYVTIYGETPYVVKTKKYVSYEELEAYLGITSIPKQYKNSIHDEGKQLRVEENNQVIVLNPVLNKEPLPCIKCGLCKKVCPLGINPLKGSTKCNHCGLCEYVCPCRIKLVKEDV